jgi:menaquinol-cytochrome c reductase iron-sulfur subunit
LHTSEKLVRERRGFLRAVIAALGSLIGVTITGSAGTYLFSTNSPAKREAWSDAGEIPKLGLSAPQQITFESRQLDGWNVTDEKASAWVVRNGDGSITAFSPWCTHLGCAYRWETPKGQFVCPCHGSCFDASGKVTAGPAPRPLDRYRTKIEGSRLWILPQDS